MKTLPSLFLSLFVVLFLSCNTNEIKNDEVSNPEILSIVENFQNPPPEYRPIPFWVWNNQVTKTEIDKQLHELQQMGYGGVFIHPRPGLITEYLSPQWFELCEYAMEQAKQKGMQTWLYDENSFPSGFAGGHVQNQMPESYKDGTGLSMRTTSILQKSDTDSAFFILKKTDSLFSEVKPEEAIGTNGEFYVFEKEYGASSAFIAGFPYTDLLRKGVTEKFIEVTMTGYEKTLGDEFGESVPGIFTDEPNIARALHAKNAIRWTPDLFSVFQKQWGYDLKTRLPLLFVETGDFKKIRHNYWQTILHLFVSRWAKPWYNYTEKMNLKWTGHYWEHGWPNPKHGGDNMAMYAYHQMPGIDMLFNNRTLRPDQFGNCRAVKELISSANQTGCKRTICESFGASGWDISFEDLKRNGDWLFATGVNFINPHLCYMTIQGTRKHDFPQSFSYHSPNWKLYKPLHDYFGRLALVLSAGKQINDILVIEPTTTAWMYAGVTPDKEKFDSIAAVFNGFVDKLEKHHYQYDLGSEYTIMERGKTHGNRFIVGKREYKLLVLPPCTENLNKTTVQLITKYLEQGGEILSFVKVCNRVDGKETDEVNNLLVKHNKQISYASEINSSSVKKYFEKSDYVYNKPKQNCDSLYHIQRQLDDGVIHFYANYHTDANAKASVMVPYDNVFRLDAITGHVLKYDTKRSNNLSEITLDLLPGESLLLYTGNSELKTTASPEKKQGGDMVESDSGMKITRCAPNVLPLDYCNLKLNNKTFNDISYWKAANLAYTHHGFDDGNPWAFKVQFQSEIVDRDTFGTNSGFTAEYIFEVDDSFDTNNISNLKIVVELGELYDVRINDASLQAIPDEWMFDRKFKVYDMKQHVTTGKNKISVTARPMSVFAEISPVFVTGDFQLQATDKGWMLIQNDTLKLQYWNTQGLPFYPDAIGYEKEYTINDTAKKYTVKLEKWKGTVAQVVVNDKNAGIIGWQPYCKDISAFVTNGKNTIIIKIYGSLHNLLGPFHAHNYKQGLVTPWSWRFDPEKQPSGKEYNTIAYGLSEDFNVYKN